MIRLIAAFVVGFAAIAARADVAIQELTTPSGISVWLVEEHSFPSLRSR